MNEIELPFIINGTNWKSTTKHIDNFHGQIKAAGAVMQAHAQIGRSQAQWIVFNFKPWRHHGHFFVVSFRNLTHVRRFQWPFARYDTK